MTKGKYTKGFTLVELLVVIAIIAILAGALFLVINPAELMKKGRDSKRMSELNELNKAIAAAMANSSQFTLTARTDSSCSANANARSATGVAGSYIQYTSTPASGLSVFMPGLPADPSNGTTFTGGTYCYYFGANAMGQWEINAHLESLDNAKYATGDGGNSQTCTTMPNAGCKFEVGTALTIAGI